MPGRRAVFAIAAVALLLASGTSASLPKLALTPDIQSALDRVSADSLRGHLSFIASDRLEGRGTPSRGLDLAAEYIAAQFRRAGLEPAVDGGYFQTAKMQVRTPDLDHFKLTMSRGDQEFSASAAEVTTNLAAGLDLSRVVVIKVDSSSNSGGLEDVTPEQVTGKIVLSEAKRGRGRSVRALLRKLRGTGPAALILVDRQASEPAEPDSQLIDPEEPPEPQSLPWIAVHGAAAVKFYDSLRSGPTGALATIHLAEPVTKTVELRNVAGILRGSDSALKNTFLVLSAHYDHLGMKLYGEGDRIYNGANDDGSGTVSVIELASALAQMKERPRRSILFVAFFGEEEGLFGSRYYARHPVVPLENTIAGINLEQMGRTDATGGRQIATASPTGFDFTDLTDYFRAAGQLTGVRINHSPRSDLYFEDSDNLSLARAGVPAETLCVAFQFPDYHAVGDEWEKIDYQNMAKVDRMVALAAIMVANSSDAPLWHIANRQTVPYVKAWKALHGG